MKQIAATLLLVLSLAAFTNCKKMIEKKKEDALAKMLAEGKWTVTAFVQNGTNRTPEFYDYEFKYYEDKTVDAIKLGTLDKKGTWDGDINTMTTSANFNVTTNPLLRINGSWHIDDYRSTWVAASQTTATDTKTMRLEKIP